MNFRRTTKSGLMTATSSGATSPGRPGNTGWVPAGVGAEARYENGKHTESPVTASVEVRFNF